MKHKFKKSYERRKKKVKKKKKRPWVKEGKIKNTKHWVPNDKILKRRARQARQRGQASRLGYLWGGKGITGNRQRERGETGHTGVVRVNQG